MSLWNSVHSRVPKQTLAGRSGVTFSSGWSKRSCPEDDKIFRVQKRSYARMQGCCLCGRSNKPGADNLFWFKSADALLPATLSYLPLKLAGAKTSIRFAWVFGATGHYVIKSLSNIPAQIKSESLHCNCQGIHWLSVCWKNIALPETQTCQDIPDSFTAWELPTRNCVPGDGGELRYTPFPTPVFDSINLQLLPLQA